ncbi:hypothetical protein cyc_04209 [Cyclospora cayetanensis]|uniref:VHS domain-containing protein n=1 Tax=Cyclospora cayetanensis TaxID=88456 RepID=A0A1D3CY65_9EIME|nr:hypothetical protein cyc_04209 [Cyclospora cayetanensis]
MDFPRGASPPFADAVASCLTYHGGPLDLSVSLALQCVDACSTSRDNTRYLLSQAAEKLRQGSDPEGMYRALELVEICVKNNGLDFARHMDEHFLRSMAKVLKITTFRRSLTKDVKEKLTKIIGGPFVHPGVATDPRIHVGQLRQSLAILASPGAPLSRRLAAYRHLKASRESLGGWLQSLSQTDQDMQRNLSSLSAGLELADYVDKELAKGEPSEDRLDESRRSLEGRQKGPQKAVGSSEGPRGASISLLDLSPTETQEDQAPSAEREASAATRGPSVPSAGGAPDLLPPRAGGPSTFALLPPPPAFSTPAGSVVAAADRVSQGAFSGGPPQQDPWSALSDLSWALPAAISVASSSFSPRLSAPAPFIPLLPPEGPSAPWASGPAAGSTSQGAPGGSSGMAPPPGVLPDLHPCVASVAPSTPGPSSSASGAAAPWHTFSFGDFVAASPQQGTPNRPQGPPLGGPQAGGTPWQGGLPFGNRLALMGPPAPRSVEDDPFADCGPRDQQDHWLRQPSQQTSSSSTGAGAEVLPVQLPMVLVPSQQDREGRGPHSPPKSPDSSNCSSSGGSSQGPPPAARGTHSPVHAALWPDTDTQRSAETNARDSYSFAAASAPVSCPASPFNEFSPSIHPSRSFSKGPVENLASSDNNAAVDGRRFSFGTPSERSTSQPEQTSRRGASPRPTLEGRAWTRSNSGASECKGSPAVWPQGTYGGISEEAPFGGPRRATPFPGAQGASNGNTQAFGPGATTDNELLDKVHQQLDEMAFNLDLSEL